MEEIDNNNCGNFSVGRPITFAQNVFAPRSAVENDERPVTPEFKRGQSDESFEDAPFGSRRKELPKNTNSTKCTETPCPRAEPVAQSVLGSFSSRIECRKQKKLQLLPGQQMSRPESQLSQRSTVQFLLAPFKSSTKRMHANRQLTSTRRRRRCSSSYGGLDWEVSALHAADLAVRRDSSFIDPLAHSISSLIAFDFNSSSKIFQLGTEVTPMPRRAALLSEAYHFSHDDAYEQCLLSSRNIPIDCYRFGGSLCSAKRTLRRCPSPDEAVVNSQIERSAQKSQKTVMAVIEAAHLNSTTSKVFRCAVPASCGVSGSSRNKESSTVRFALGALAAVLNFDNFNEIRRGETQDDLTRTIGGWAVFATIFFVVGLPLLQLEIALGHIFEGGAIKVFDQLHRRFGGLGVSMMGSCLLSVVISHRLAADALRYLIFSLAPEVPWIPSVGVAKSCGMASSAECQNRPECRLIMGLCEADKIHAANEFYNAVSALSSGSSLFSGNLGSVIVCFALLAIGAVLGHKFLSYFTLASIFVLLTTGILILLSLELPFTPQSYIAADWSPLINVEIWVAAVHRVLSTVGICMGVYFAVASYSPAGYNCLKGALLVLVADVAVHLFLFLVNTAGVEELASQTGRTPVEVQEDSLSNVFVIMPAVLSRTKAIQMTATLFYFTLLFTILSSEMARMEGIIVPILESRIGLRLSRRKVVPGIIAAAMLLVLPFLIHSDDWFLEWRSIFVENIGVVFLFVTSIFVGWVFNVTMQLREVGKWAVLCFTGSFWLGMTILCQPAAISSVLGKYGVKFPYFVLELTHIIGPICMFVGILIATHLGFIYAKLRAHEERQELYKKPQVHKSMVRPDRCLSAIPVGGRIQPRLGNAMQRSSIVASSVVSARTNLWLTKSRRDVIWWLFLGNIEMLRIDINLIIPGNRSVFRLGLSWSLLIRFLIPVMMWFVMASDINDFLDPGLWKGASFSLSLAAMGLLGIMTLLALLFGAFPHLLNPLRPPETEYRDMLSLSRKILEGGLKNSFLEFFDEVSLD